MYSLTNERGRIMKKMLSVLLTVLLSFTTTVNCFTLVSADQLTIKNVSDNVAESFLNSLDTNLEIQYATPLYDGNDEINGYWYHLSNDDDIS